MSRVTIKAMINKQRTKVLFAEANSDFVDILLSFLALPLGKIAKLLEDHAVGSLSNLYKSVANLDSTFFVNEAAKLMLLNPGTSFTDVCPNLKLDITDTKPTKYFACNKMTCRLVSRTKKARDVCMYDGLGSCDICRKPMLFEMGVGKNTKGGDGVGFTVNTTSFVICDDLRVEPYATGFLQTLTNFGIGDINVAKLEDVTFGIEEIIGLLQCCFNSSTPLTDLVLNTTQNSSIHSARKKRKTSAHNYKMTRKKEDGISKEIILKITVEKSTKKLLFAQAESEFVELLFSFLTIPLGEVESLLDSMTCCNSLDNLYRSLAAINKYFRAPDLKSRLMNPKLAPGYSSTKQFLPLTEEIPPPLYLSDENTLYYRSSGSLGLISVSLKSPKGSDSYVKEPSAYMVTDDLTVTLFGMTSGVSILHRLNIPLSEVDELEVSIGYKEVLGILRATLTTTSALSTGLNSLIYNMARKFPKHEH